VCISFVQDTWKGTSNLLVPFLFLWPVLSYPERGVKRGSHKTPHAPVLLG
jgi:hypothetical protein